MCGIAGFLGKGGELDAQHMIEAIKHRGPDDSGVWSSHNVALAHARLSILDTSPRGHQPMWNLKKTTVIVFNGEIYNYRELIDIYLRPKGIPIKSGTDTEVILHLYDLFGEKVFEKIHGMFAIAIYDSLNQRLILARDRFGKKPLYVGRFNGTIVFGSEIKALIAHPLFKKELDYNALNKYLALDYVPTPISIWKEVKKLSPATYTVFEKGKERSTTYWKLEKEKVPENLEEALTAFDIKINNAVKNRLIADVPLGVFLSGGIDSSTIAWYAAKNSAKPIKTFSIGFSEKSYDESLYANLVSKHINSDHNEERLSANACLKLIEDLANVCDEPLADASILPTLLLSHFAREKVTVALGGDGADELFGGYDTFIADKIQNYIPNFLKSTELAILKGLSAIIPSNEKYMSAGFKIHKFSKGLSDEIHRHERWLGTFPPEEQFLLFSKEYLKMHSIENVYSATEEARKESPISDTNQRELYAYLRTYLMDQVLVKVDRASMYYSLEIRTPFLDTTVVSFASSIPYEWKLRGLTPKYFLKELMKHRLPKEIIERPKKGFGIPLTRWLRHELKPLLDETLSKERIERGNIFNWNYITHLKKEHESGRRDHRKKLWNLLIFELWRQKYLPS